MKKIIKLFIVIGVVVQVSGCVMTPYYGGSYYGGGHGYYVTPQSYWGYYNQPIMFYDPFANFGSAFLGVVGASLMYNNLFDHHHHHHH